MNFLITLILNYLWGVGSSAGESLVNQMISHALKYPKKKAVYLDCGCDDGLITLKIGKALQAKTLLGIDILKESCLKARKKGIKAYNIDLNKKLPFKSNSIDYITASQVIEHVLNVDNFLSELRRVLKADGVFVLCTENLASYHNIFALLLGNQPYSGPFISDKVIVSHRPFSSYKKNTKLITSNPYKIRMPGHTNIMTTKALVKLCNGSGFKVEKVFGTGFYPFPSFIATVLSNLDKNHCVFQGVVLKKIRKPN